VNEQELGEQLREHAVRHRVPGAALGFLRRGAATFAYYGAANAASGDPVTAETRFSVGSLTKAMVATVILRLEQVGRLSLEDPVSDHVPELASEAWAARATVRDLLANRSGLPLRRGLEFDFSGSDGSSDDALSRYAMRVAEAAPTTAVWSYTNAGWCLLGRTIETAAGLTWEDAMYAYLLEPERLAQTTFAIGPDRVPRAVGHELDGESAIPVPPLDARALGPAGTTTISTAADMLGFAALHLEDSSLAAMRDSQTDVRIHGWFDAWCHGWARFDWNGHPVWGWDGVISGERSFLRLLPEQEAAVVLMTNAGSGRALYRSLFPELLHACFGVRMPSLRLEPSPLAAGDLSRYAGVYAWPDRRCEVKATNGSLLIDSGDGPTEALAIDDRTFLVDAADPDNPTVTFGAFDAAGSPGALYLMLWALPRLHRSQTALV
jgi:CubicO group peptidase (beta-lactamase class C family)